MSPSRMAFKPFLFLTLLWTTLSTVATAERNTGIPSEITDFVPYCARDCFRSFITANFGSSGCGSSPSLECLCRRTGASGYTLGEGAYACSVAEASREKCKGADADTGAPVEAYNMCSQVSNAAPATHDTIVATLIIPSGTGGLVVPTAAPTTASPTSSTTTSPTRSTPTPTSIESSESPVPSSNPSRLSAPQIAGISLGVIAGVVAFGVLLIFLARCIRRRRFGDEDSEAGFAKMRDSLSYHQGSPPALHGGLQISNPIRKPTVEMDFQRPLGAYKQYYGGQPAEYQQPAPEPVHPGMIGVAISPNKPVAIQSNSNANMPAANSASKIGFAAPPAVVFTPPSRSNTMDQVAPSPPKPALTLAIPKGRAPTTGARDSIVTEFAEDGEGESNPNTSSIWRPPPSEPQSASTYYYADKGGNWVLRRASTAKKPVAASRDPVSPQMEELPSPEDRTRAERAQDFPVVRPLRISKNFQPQLGSPIAFKDQARANRSSSIYTSNNNMYPSAVSSVAATPVPPTSTYYAMMREGRDLTQGGRAKQQQQQPRVVPSTTRNKRVSYQSSTSIESGAAGPLDDDEDIIENEPQVSLSPVAQSPLTPLEGKSPVSYPKIPKNGARLSLFPPPSTAVRDHSKSPPGQASPTLGASSATKKTTPQTAPNKRLLYPGGLGLPSNPNPNRNPGQIKTGSPETRVGVFPTAVPISAPPVAELPATPPRRPSPARTQQGLGISEQRQRQYHQRPPHHHHHQQQQQQMYQAPSQVQQQRQQQRPGPPPPHMQMQMQSQPQRYPSPPQYQQPQQPQPYQPYQPPAVVSASPEGNQSQASAAQQSSLLAKRLGAEKAAALSLGGSGSGDTTKPTNKRREKWTRESFGPKNINTNSSSNKGNKHDDDDLPYPVPITPGWVPQLTPTKRGDDLYLNVQ